MALNEGTVIEEVRGITDYPDTVLSDNQIRTLVQTAQRDITATTQNYDIDWYNDSSIDGNRSLVWTTALYCKIKSGEIDGVDMDIGNLKVDSIDDKEAAVWYQKASKYIQSLFVAEDTHMPFGSSNVERNNRTYGSGGNNTSL